MSRNFELLQSLGREQKLFSSPALCLPGETEKQPFKLFSGDFEDDPEISRLCQRLFAGGGEGPEVRIVTFCSVYPATAEGEICARAAMTLAAHVNRTVCVVDANVHSPSLHKFFGVRNQSGFSEAIRSNSTFTSHAHQIGSSNLALLTAGLAVSGPQMLPGENLAFRMRELHSHFDYVLIHGPEIPDRGQGIFLGKLSDGVVLILEANSTRRDTAKRVKLEMENAQVPLLGAVLNNRTFPIPEPLYSKLL